MEIKFDLKKSNFKSVNYYGKLILTDDEENEIKVDITVRKNDDSEELFVCYPSKKGKDDKYYSTVFMSDKLYKKINKVLNKEFNK